MALKRLLKGNGQFLHAKLLGFTHPTTGESMVLKRHYPELFEETLKKLRKMIDFFFQRTV